MLKSYKFDLKCSLKGSSIKGSMHPLALLSLVGAFKIEVPLRKGSLSLSFLPGVERFVLYISPTMHLLSQNQQDQWAKALKTVSQMILSTLYILINSGVCCSNGKLTDAISGIPTHLTTPISHSHCAGQTDFFHLLFFFFQHFKRCSAVLCQSMLRMRLSKSTEALQRLVEITSNLWVNFGTNDIFNVVFSSP